VLVISSHRCDFELILRPAITTVTTVRTDGESQIPRQRLQAKPAADDLFLDLARFLVRHAGMR
jgi:hypothetical protein